MTASSCVSNPGMEYSPRPPIIPISAFKSAPFASDDLFPGCIPAHGALLPVALDRHAARDGNAEPQLERAVRLLAGADAVEKILHVGARQAAGGAHHFVAVGPIHLLGRSEERRVGEEGR